MHAVGASGIMQVFEIATQLWGRWAEVHGDEKGGRNSAGRSRQTGPTCRCRARRGRSRSSHAGVGSHVTATVLMDPDHLLNKTRREAGTMSSYGQVQVKTAATNSGATSIASSSTCPLETLTTTGSWSA